MNKVKKLRRGQTIQPFGVGSIFDIEGEAFVVKDITQWRRPQKIIKLDRLQQTLGYKQLRSFSNFENEKESVPVKRFPAWYHCPSCKRLKRIRGESSNKNNSSPTCDNPKCRFTKLSPMRFIAYCDNGHLQEINWQAFAHYQQQESSIGRCTNYEKIYFTSTGKLGGDFDQMFISCKACDAKPVSLKNIMSSGFVPPSLVYGKKQKCAGTQPWFIKGDSQETCELHMRAEPRGSSSIYRPKIISALDIETDEIIVEKAFDTKKLDDLITYLKEEYDDHIDSCILAVKEDDHFVKIEKRAKEIGISINKAKSYILSELENQVQPMPKVDAPIGEYSDVQQILIKDELDLFRLRKDIDRPNFKMDFFELEENNTPTGLLFSSIAQIRRLREIRVLTGFTRGKGLKEVKVDRDGKTDWLPTIEAFGEGIYFEINKHTLTNYFIQHNDDLESLTSGQISELNKLKEHYYQLEIEDSILFILTHTLSHLLIRQLTFNSGYSSSALRERIFVDADSNYAGIMIYTSDLDSEGTMGGLVDQGRIESVSKVVDRIFESAIWCSTDPVCRETQSQGFSGLNRSACHCCSLISETSCTFQNAMLNRLTLGGLGKSRDEVLGLFSFINDMG
jgi:ssDNA-binding Zn-finger/Zn-ribbon topoisomerase 1